jgi:hypothetical protein
VVSSSGEVTAELDLEDADAKATIDQDEKSATEAASRAGAVGATKGALEAELAAVDDMLAIAEDFASRPDARVRWLAEWIKSNMLSGKTWNNRRLIIFTEYEDTRRWLERRLLEAIDGTDKSDERVLVFSGATGMGKREAVKRAFNTDPAIEPVRILLCTDAAREGINLQTYCSDLIHFDLPWNPSRLTTAPRTSGCRRPFHSKTESASPENNLLHVPAPDNDLKNSLKRFAISHSLSALSIGRNAPQPGQDPFPYRCRRTAALRQERRSLDVVLDHEQKLDCLGPQRLRRIIVRSDSLVKQLPWGHKS